MADQVTPSQSLGPEFWAVIGTGIAIAALILTVAGWQRADTRELRQEIRALDDNLSGKIETIQSDLAGINQRSAIVESKIGAAVIEPETDIALAAVSG